MIISRLRNRRGKVRDLLGVSGTESLDISGDRWGSRSSRGTVLQGLVFENAILRSTEIGVRFVECQFVNCTFENLRSEGEFWGASNLWVNCSFSAIRLSSAVSPQNRFENCTFAGLALRRYQPCETAFVGCFFDRLSVEGMKAEPNLRNVAIRRKMRQLWDYPEIEVLDRLRVSVLFERCRFKEPEFRDCHFRDIAFFDSVVSSPTVEGCDFDGVSGDIEWHAHLQAKDLNEAYLQALLVEIEERLGRESWTFRKVHECARKYPPKEFRRRWSADVIEAGIPDREYETLEVIIDSLRGRFA